VHAIAANGAQINHALDRLSRRSRRMMGLLADAIDFVAL
jgi:hypothetical protein